MGGMDVESLYNEFGKKLFGYLLAETADYSSAEDLFQETFLRIQLYGKSFRGEGDARNYLFTTARNLLRNWLEKRNKEKERMVKSETGDGGDPAGLVESKSLRLVVADCVHSLPNDEREVLLLREYENLKLRQIAKRLSVPEGTVKTRLRRGLQNLKKKLQEAGVLERL